MIKYLETYRLIGCNAICIGRLSAVLPIISIGRLASDNNRYRPIIGAGRLSADTDYSLFIFRLDHLVIKSNK